MTTAVQRRRGTNTEHASFTGLEGEISVNTTNESVHVHDGSTAGGFELMRADGANSTVTLGDISGVTAGTGLSGGGTTGTVTLDIDGTVATLAGTQTFTNKTLTSPILNTPTIGTSFNIGGATITEAELEILDGATVTTTELNYVDGVTSAIQTQIDAKAPLASPSFTGNVSVGGTVDGRDLAADGTKLDLINQGVATTDSPAFAGGTFTGEITANGGIALGDNDKATFGAGDDLQIYHDGSNSYLKDAGAGYLNLLGTGRVVVGHPSNGDVYLNANYGGDVELFFSNSKKFETTSTGIDVTGTATMDGLTVDTTTLAVDATNNRVGIGTSSPDRSLHVYESNTPTLATFQNDGGEALIKLQSANNSQGIIEFGDPQDGNQGRLVYNHSGSYMSMWTADSERMRIDSSGSIGLRATSNVVSSTSGSGAWVSDGGYVAIARQGTTTAHPPLYVNQTGIDGQIITLRKDGATVAALGNYATSYLLLGGYSGSDAFLIMGSSAIAPATSTGAARDNAIDLGTSSRRFDDIYATNGTIQTSDRNEKQDIAELSDAEQRVAVAAKGLLRKFRWKDSVAEKGDDARIHFGIIAQDLQAAFAAEGLDAGNYAMFISTTWWEQDVEVPAVEAAEAVYETQTDDEGNETQVLIDEAVEAVDAYTETHNYSTIEEAPEGATEKTRLGVRYSELLAFIIAAL